MIDTYSPYQLLAAGKPYPRVFLETSTETNVALYRRHGFEVIGEYWVRPDSPPSWAMWREPAPLA